MAGGMGVLLRRLFTGECAVVDWLGLPFWKSRTFFFWSVLMLLR